MTPQQIEALNIAGQCRATASSPLAKNILVDEGNGLLTELLLDAARIIEALAQPEQEPVAWMDEEMTCIFFDAERPEPFDFDFWKPLYATPPQRKPLTDEEIERACVPLGAAMLSFTEVARAIEAAHGIKENT